MIIVQEQNGKLHFAGSEARYTLCNKQIDKYDVINTIACNACIPSVCKECGHWMEVRLHYLRRNPRSFKGTLLQSLCSQLINIEPKGTDRVYTGFWYMLHKYKRKIP